jgi:hypothetical protein
LAELRRFHGVLVSQNPDFLGPTQTHDASFLHSFFDLVKYEQKVVGALDGLGVGALVG